MSIDFDLQDEVEFRDDAKAQLNNWKMSKDQQKPFDLNGDSKCWTLEFQLWYSMVYQQRSLQLHHFPIETH